MRRKEKKKRDKIGMKIISLYLRVYYKGCGILVPPPHRIIQASLEVLSKGY